jgi:hypothetical protein
MSSLTSFPRLILGTLLLLLPFFGYAQEKPPALPELMVEPVVASASLMQTVLAEGAPETYVLLSEMLDGGITASLNDSHKFRVILKRPEGGPPPNVKQVRLQIRLDDFQDLEKRANWQSLRFAHG